ncbi:adenosylmethionine decarboxylase [Novosphingobium guangzhouense]|uniref:S-adenosylmethionine decarboxylase proenzyme n=1 Tax=Novosphingobium guangzhouense TaxID=1850347 RepID=A0A2K2FWB5_9SPHN|nr:adenosylmethionine decarboxylase [Novosphingobium guangzhouense]PNU03048.1 S-adenosylmethionine decarboxylase proenzyme [Novosphingobium guangzhouense]
MTHRAGTSVHLIADFGECVGLDDLSLVETALRDAAEAAHLTVLNVRLHHFGQGMGVTGVALLAESHISIHTWPEEGVAAVDIFVCGENAAPESALTVICEHLGGRVIERHRIERLRAFSASSSAARVE